MISVIVPVYNTAQRLPACLDAILGQTYRALEVILVDDGSTDGSGAICDAYAARDLRAHVIHQENRGVSAARNAGLDAATGGYVMFVDSDDRIPAHAAETLLKAAEASKADLVMARVRYIAPEGERMIGDSYGLQSLENKRGELPRLYLQYLLRFEWGSLEGKLFRREAMEAPLFRGGAGEVSLRFKDVHWEDSLFVLSLFARLDRVEFLPAPLYDYIARPGSRSQGVSPETGAFAGYLYAALRAAYCPQARTISDMAAFALRLRGGTPLPRATACRLAISPGLGLYCKWQGLPGKTRLKYRWMLLGGAYDYCDRARI